MRNVPDDGSLILVVQDVEETRDGLEKLLTRDGYRVDAARAEDAAVIRAQRQPPHLLLVNLGQPPAEVITVARRIRDRAGLRQEVPIVIFCSEAVGEGEEVAFGNEMYVTRPDNFNQLRRFLGRLLGTPRPAPATSANVLSRTICVLYCSERLGDPHPSPLQAALPVYTLPHHTALPTARLYKGHSIAVCST